MSRADSASLCITSRSRTQRMSGRCAFSGGEPLRVLAPDPPQGHVKGIRRGHCAAVATTERDAQVEDIAINF